MLLFGEKIPFIFMPLLYYNYYFIIDFLICEWYNYTERTFLDREDSMKISEMPTEKQLKHYTFPPTNSKRIGFKKGFLNKCLIW